MRTWDSAERSLAEEPRDRGMWFLRIRQTGQYNDGMRSMWDIHD